MANSKDARTFVTAQQAAVHALFVRHRSMSAVARMLGVTQIRVREALVQVERNRMRDQGLQPPPLREMMRGDVTTRFGVSRDEFGGRPAKHQPNHHRPTAKIGGDPGAARAGRVVATPRGPVARFVVTSVETGRPVHLPFWSNLKAFAGRVGAEIVVLPRGFEGLIGPNASDVRTHVGDHGIEIAGVVDLAADARVNSQATRPLDGLRSRRDRRWTIFPHAGIQLETLPRVRDDGLRVQLTSGSLTLPPDNAAGREGREDLGAVVVEIAADGASFCRHVLTAATGDGSFQDLDLLARNGTVAAGTRSQALTFGDLHHAHLDPLVAAATWGIGSSDGLHGSSLVDRLRPHAMIFHDVCDFQARSHHDARDSHRRFAHMIAGRDCVRAELEAVASFLALTRRDWATSYVVDSNHHEALIRWLRETDFRVDPVNAVFFLEASLALHRRLAAGGDVHGFFEQTMRGLSPDGLPGVRFLRPSESLAIAGIENAVHGHKSVDGKRGGLTALEALGIRLTIGHMHRPATRGGVYGAGVCHRYSDYARGPLTAWAMGHVVTYSNGARQHLIFDRNRFHG